MADLVEKVDRDADEGDDNDNEPVVVRINFIMIVSRGTYNFFIQEEESTATFTPVVQLETVETKSHEEDEDVVYKQ